MIEPFLAAFVIGLIGEIADKTQFVILGLTLKYKSGFKVFSGALLAHGLMDGVAILVGFSFGSFLDNGILKFIVGGLFIVYGIYMLVKLKIKKKKKEKKIVSSKHAFVASFLTISVIEIGDKTQVASALLSAEYLTPVLVFLGVFSALALTIGLNVFIGSKLAERIPRRTLKLVTALLFILFGVVSLVRI